MATNTNEQVPSSSTRGPGPQRRQAAVHHRNSRLCRTSQYQPPGSDKVGLSPGNQPSKIVWELEYGLKEQQFKALSSRFPGVAFVQVGFDCHDHPIAHTSYRIVWENIMRKLKPGNVVCDIAGNPQHNEQFNKAQLKRASPIKIDTFCKVESPKDSIRCKTRWGPKAVGDHVRWEEMSLYDMYRNQENRDRFAQYDVFLMNHVLYYYTKSEINQLLNLNPSSVLYATVHKLDGQNGEINCGEQRYDKDFQTGKVTQTNVETGECYQHDDPAPWFKDFCYADEHGAIAWTINKGCDDTYVITITSTEARLVPEHCWLGSKVVFDTADGRITVTEAVASDPPPAYAVEEVVIKTHDFVPGYAVVKEKRVKITHPELYECLKNFMINKPRNGRTLTDLTHKAHREVGNNTLYNGIGGTTRVKIDSQALTQHIFAAWQCGAPLEAELFNGVVSTGSSLATVNRNLAGKSLALGPSNAAKQALRLALGITSVMRSRDSVEAVLAHLDDLL